MIIGGVNAGGKTGNMRTGYSTTYLPCRVVVGTGALIAALNETSVIKYSASAEIRNIGNTAWVALPTVTYFQTVLRISASGVNSMSMTLRKPETWGIDSDSGELLRPYRSGATVRVTLSMTYQGATYTKGVFYGRIVSYTETQGFSGGAVNMELEDSRAIMEQPNTSDKTFTNATTYRVMLDLSAGAGFTALCFFASDAVVDSFILGDLQLQTTYNADGTMTSRYLQYGYRSFSAAASALIGTTARFVDSLGRYFVGASTSYGSIEAVQSGGLVKLSDSGMVSMTYSSRYQFNAIRCNFTRRYIDRTVTPNVWASEPRRLWSRRADDVVKRGEIWSKSVLSASNYTDAVNLSIQTLFREVYGEISLETRLNPFIEPDTFVLIDSERSRKECLIAVQDVRHQYSCGRAVTYVSSAIVCPEGYS